MDRNEFIELLYKGFEVNGLKEVLCEEAAEKLYDFYVLFVEENKITNLTAITDEVGVVLKHFVDCCSIAPLMNVDAKVIDIGCGGGFPTIPLAIVRPDLEITAIDSTGKKIDFVNKAARCLNLNNVNAISTRAEDYCNENREKFDYCVSRAVARLNILDELCIPFVKDGGSFVAMKSNKGEEELAEAIKGIKALGAEVDTVRKDSFELCDMVTSRELMVFKKTRSTPKQYPRRYSQILKKPL